MIEKRLEIRTSLKTRRKKYEKKKKNRVYEITKEGFLGGSVVLSPPANEEDP